MKSGPPRTLRELGDTVGVVVLRDGEHGTYQDNGKSSEVQLRHVLLTLAFFAFLWATKYFIMRKPGK
ncbi:hypothetical protein LSM04_005631 [Trypanosoma melophagium]|uniref:uncharacterized protein n=1 Tax=Trypanosoma melophagium TaxID=715481 RepID=UPI00351A621F|nr:hypothetical protein LSM04_005631 [Trypanosoma melophagium]